MATLNLFRRPRLVLVFIAALLLSFSLVHLIIQYQYQIRNTLSYATRPLWDKADGPTNVIAHYYAEGMEMDQHACKLHGWNRRGEKDIQVLDAVLMSSEVDLLEIRMNELDSVVDKFFIIESNATFTGLPKETYFANNHARFAKFKDKIIYQLLPGYALPPNGSPWDVEASTRDAMTSMLRSYVKALPPDVQSMIIMSDVDEIPAKHSIALLEACDFGQSIHLQLRNFWYSFEWYLDMSSWRSSVHMWRNDVIYRHSKSGERILADAGWHCSYCFRTIEEYIVKMRGFSHSDRIGGNMRLLDPRRIQDTICHGKEIFGMLPEAYSYRDLITQMNLEPLKTAVGLPRYLINNAKDFHFLLPGGCIRESQAPGSRSKS